MTKRLYDIFFAAVGLLLLSPLFLLLAAAVKGSDGGPVLFRQRRVGLRGRPFLIVKFRTMVPNAERLGAGITKDGDPRVTAVGRFLRRSKLDELPQLWNVLVGDMSLVGPRPEVPRYVEKYTEDQRRVLNLKPGVTDLATLVYRDEEKCLAGAEDVEKHYLEQVMPRKIELNLTYASRANVWEDTKIILRTFLAMAHWPGAVAARGGVLRAPPALAAAQAIPSHGDDHPGT